MSAIESLVGQMTVSELAAKAGMSVSSIVEIALSGAKAPRAPKMPAPSAAAAGPTKVGNGRVVDTRSAEGREIFQGRVLDFVQDAPGKVSAQDVRAAVGGTAAQVRKALNVAIENGDLKYGGRARGTRYWT